jgi:hypothetical protein
MVLYLLCSNLAGTYEALLKLVDPKPSPIVLALNWDFKVLTTSLKVLFHSQLVKKVTIMGLYVLCSNLGCKYEAL